MSKDTVCLIPESKEDLTLIMATEPDLKTICGNNNKIGCSLFEDKVVVLPKPRAEEFDEILERGHRFFDGETQYSVVKKYLDNSLGKIDSNAWRAINIIDIVNSKNGERSLVLQAYLEMKASKHEKVSPDRLKTLSEIFNFSDKDVKQALVGQVLTNRLRAGYSLKEAINLDAEEINRIIRFMKKYKEVRLCGGIDTDFAKYRLRYNTDNLEKAKQGVEIKPSTTDIKTVLTITSNPQIRELVSSGYLKYSDFQRLWKDESIEMGDQVINIKNKTLCAINEMAQDDPRIMSQFSREVIPFIRERTPLSEIIKDLCRKLFM